MCWMMQDPFSPAKQTQDVFSPPPLERFEPPAQPQPTVQPQPQANGALHAEPAPAPAPVRNGLSSNGLQNGFTEFVSTKVSFSISISLILCCGKRGVISLLKLSLKFVFS